MAALNNDIKHIGVYFSYMTRNPKMSSAHAAPLVKFSDIRDSILGSFGLSYGSNMGAILL